MTKLERDKLIKKLEQVKSYYCKNNYCGHFDCKLCVEEIYGEMCTLDTVIEAIENDYEKI